MRRGLLGLLLLACPVVAEDPARDRARDLEQHVRKVLDKAEASVVAVVVSHSPRYPALSAADRNVPGRLGPYAPLPGRQTLDPLDLADPRNVADHRFGSGVVVDDRLGLVLTNFHLLDGATKVFVRAASGGGCYADVHAADARSDLAVLKLLDAPAGLRKANLADVRLADGPTGEKATVARGSFVLTLGHPTGSGVADGVPSTSWGVLSGVRRRVIPPRPVGDPTSDDSARALYHLGSLLETDARITLGCSGAALLNLDGDVIGMTTPMTAVTGVESAGGFAVPFDAGYRRIVDVLKDGKEVEYGFLGVTFVNPGAGNRGLPIGEVTPGTPAAVAGLVGVGNPDRTPPDRIVAVDGRPVRDLDDLFYQLGASLAGTTVRLTVVRDGKPRDVDVTLAKFRNAMPVIASNRPAAVFGLRVDYSSVLLLQDPNVRQYGLPAGVMIRGTEPGSPADQKVRGPGAAPWIITHVNGKAVKTPAEFHREADGKPKVALKLIDPSPMNPQPPREISLP